MSISFSVLEASAYSLRYLAIADGAGQDNTLTQAQLIADAAEGPLKAKLLSSPIQGVSTPANNAWGALVADPALSVYVSPASAPPALIGYAFALVGMGTVHTLVGDAAGAGKAVIEIRYNPTIDR